VDKKTRGGARQTRLTENNRDTIRAWLDDDCSISLCAIAEKCRSELDITVSEQTIGRAINSFHYTLKRVHMVPERRNDLEAINSRALYANQFMRLLTTISQAQLIFLDEVGFSVSM
jgi:transposase